MARPSGPAARTQRRRPLRTRRRFGWGWVRRLPLLWIAALAVCGFLTYFFAGSGIFSVHTVLAESPANGRLTAGQRAAIADQCRCIGANIFVVRPDDIKRRLAQIPTLEIERVYTRLPNQVVVEAKPKMKIAVWRTPEAAYAVDATGEVLQVWKRPFPRAGWGALPVFDEKYGDDFKKGHRLLVGQMLPHDDPLAYALHLHATVPPDVRPLVTQYLYRRFIGMTVIGRGRWWALFGPADSALDQRMEALHQALLPTDGSTPLLGAGACIDLRGSFGSPGYQYMRHDHRCGS